MNNTRLNMVMRGRVELVHLLDGRLDGRHVPVGETRNVVVDLAFDELLPRILGRDAGADIAIISIGEGGNYDQQGTFIGTRVAPDVSDTAMRLEIFRAGIVQIDFPAAKEVRFTGLLRQSEAVSSDIDEFGLLSTDGRMFAHAINADSGPATPTVPYVKPAGAIFAVRWTLTTNRG